MASKPSPHLQQQQLAAASLPATTHIPVSAAASPIPTGTVFHHSFNHHPVSAAASLHSPFPSHLHAAHSQQAAAAAAAAAAAVVSHGTPVTPGASPYATAAYPMPTKKPRKPYVITKNRENWTPSEHQAFLDALKKYGRNWKQIEMHVKTKSVIQIRSHAQKHFIKVQKNNTGEHVPPPRPKRKNSTSSVAAAVAASPQPSPSAPASPALFTHPAAAAAAFMRSPNHHLTSYAMMGGAAPFAYHSPYAHVNPHAMAAAIAAASAAHTTVPQSPSHTQQQQHVAQPPAKRSKSLPASSTGGQSSTGRTVKKSSPVLSTSPLNGPIVGSTSNVAKTEATLKKVTPKAEWGKGGFEKQRSMSTSALTRASPNFANIYSFFAKMFDPQIKFDALEGVRDADMSPLDKEVVKLLIPNLEVNIGNKAFRQHLLDAYRQRLQQTAQPIAG